MTLGKEEVQSTARRSPFRGRRAAAASVLFAGVFVLAGGAVLAARRTPHDCTDLGSVDRFKIGTVVSVPCVPVYVVNTAEPVAFLARSTHLDGEPIRWSESQRLFLSLHDETFDALGNVVNGPAPRGLWRCPTEVREKRLRIAVPPGISKSEIIAHCQQ